jgi:molecular chaperone GrpE
MADPRRQTSGADGTGSFFRRRIPIDRPEEETATVQPPEPMEAPTASAGAEPEQVPREPLMEELIIGSEQSDETGREIRELTDSLVRLQAEFDNYRKRQARDFRRLSSQGRKELISELLVVLDNFDRAWSHRSADGESPQELAEGLFRTVDQMRRIVTQSGLSDLDVRVNDPFDPNIHEAVLADEVEGLARDTILEIFQKGYLFDQELLRPAMVRVGKPTNTELDASVPELPIPELLIPDPPFSELLTPNIPIPEKTAPEPASPEDDLEIEYEGEWGPGKE